MDRYEADKILIINGDDFGASPYINKAIELAHRGGVLTSASLMVNGDAFDEAVAIAKAHRKLGVGIHITLARGKATLSKSEIPDLVDAGGNFGGGPAAAGFKYFFRSDLRIQLKREIEAQIRKFLSAGLTPSHIDGHLHFHVHPSVLELLLDLAEKYAIKAFRLPRESLFANLPLDHGNLFLQAAHGFIFHRLCSHAEKRLQKCRIAYPGRFFGLLSSGRMDENYLLKMLDRLAPGVTEVGMHPAVSLPNEMKAWAPHYKYRRELEALTSGRVKELISSRGIRLANYHIFSGERGSRAGRSES